MVTIRSVNPDDAAAIRDLALASPETGNVQVRPEFHADAYTATLAPYPGSQGLLACTPQGRVVGQIFWRPVRVLIGGRPMPATHAFFLAVHPDFRRQGIGYRLSQAAREAGQAAGGRLFYGSVQQGNRASIGTLRKLGCLPVGRLMRAVVPLRRRLPRQGWFTPSDLGGVRVRAVEAEDLPAFAQAANDFYAGHNFWTPLAAQALQDWLHPDDGRIRRELYVAEDAGGRLVAGVAVSDATALRSGAVDGAPWLIRLIGRSLGLIDAAGHMRFVSAGALWYRSGQAAVARYLWDWLRWHLRFSPPRFGAGSGATALLIDYDLRGPAARAVTRPWYVPVARYDVYACPCEAGSTLSEVQGAAEESDFMAVLDPTRFVAGGLV
jgi:ribosomal protein S18 acetylase RimI-like enzyme